MVAVGAKNAAGESAQRDITCRTLMSEDAMTEGSAQIIVGIGMIGILAGSECQRETDEKNHERVKRGQFHGEREFERD
jgi:hypothetical protein